VRQLGRQVAEHVYNQFEPAEPESLPHYVHHEAGEYRQGQRTLSSLNSKDFG
jgi:hypothetical protein